MRRHEDALPLLGHLLEVDVSLLGDLLHQLLGVPAFLLCDRDEVVVHVRHEHAGLIAHEGHGEKRLDPGRAASDDRDRPGRSYRVDVAIAEHLHRTDAIAPGVAGARLIGTPDGSRPLGKRTTLVGEPLALSLRLDVDEFLQLTPELDALDAVVGDAQPHQRIGETHDAESDATDSLGERIDLRQRVLVDVDDVVEKVHRKMDVALESVPIHLTVAHIVADVDRAQVADIVWQKWLLTARVGRFVVTYVRNWIVAIRFVDEKAAWLSGAPRAIDHLVPHRPGVQLARHFAGTRIDEVVAGACLHCFHELVGDGDRDVEVRDLRQIFLAGDEIHDIGMIDAQNSHIGAAARAALLHGIRRRVVKLHERNWSRCNASGRTHHRAFAAQLGKTKAGASA